MCASLWAYAWERAPLLATWRRLYVTLAGEGWAPPVYLLLDLRPTGFGIPTNVTRLICLNHSSLEVSAGHRCHSSSLSVPALFPPMKNPRPSSRLAGAPWGGRRRKKKKKTPLVSPAVKSCSGEVRGKKKTKKNSVTFQVLLKIDGDANAQPTGLWSRRFALTNLQRVAFKLRARLSFMAARLLPTVPVERAASWADSQSDKEVWRYLFLIRQASLRHELLIGCCVNKSCLQRECMDADIGRFQRCVAGLCIFYF